MAPTPALGPARGAYGRSREWIGHVERYGNRLLGWVRAETGERPVRAYSQSLWWSPGVWGIWRVRGQIITGTGRGPRHPSWRRWRNRYQRRLLLPLRLVEQAPRMPDCAACTGYESGPGQLEEILLWCLERADPGGLSLAIYAHVHFKPLGVTGYPGRYGTWKRPDPHDVYVYADLSVANTGENQLRGSPLVAGLQYVQPNEG
jgi:hypothetical protein